jgi:hypothetical protein
LAADVENMTLKVEEGLRETAREEKEEEDAMPRFHVNLAFFYVTDVIFADIYLNLYTQSLLSPHEPAYPLEMRGFRNYLFNRITSKTDGNQFIRDAHAYHERISFTMRDSSVYKYFNPDIAKPVNEKLLVIRYPEFKQRLPPSRDEMTAPTAKKWWPFVMDVSFISASLQKMEHSSNVSIFEYLYLSDMSARNRTCIFRNPFRRKWIAWFNDADCLEANSFTEAFYILRKEMLARNQNKVGKVDISCFDQYLFGTSNND